jgi:hypothetical protein
MPPGKDLNGPGESGVEASSKVGTPKGESDSSDFLVSALFPFFFSFFSLVSLEVASNYHSWLMIVLHDDPMTSLLS